MWGKAKNISVCVLAFVAGTVVSFFTLPIWVIFVINAAKEGSRTDWFSLVGSAFGALIALGAAFGAWFAVQRQIILQQNIAAQQIAIQQYTILQETIGFLQEEERLNAQVKTCSDHTLGIEQVLAKQTNWPSVKAAKSIYDEQFDEYRAVHLEFRRAGKNMWSFPQSHELREDVRRQLLRLISDVSTARSTITSIIARSPDQKISSADMTLISEINLGKRRLEVAATCAKFDMLLEKEIIRLSEKIRTIRENAGI